MTAPLAGLRIGILTAAASRLGGGVFEAVASHVDMLHTLGADPHVFALADRHATEDAVRLGHARRHVYRVAGPRQVGFAPGLVRGLMDARLDCLHLHGIWMYPSAAGARWAGITGRPYFISPHGMLDPWITARGRWKKAAARRAYERRSWRRATALHALTLREADDIVREAGPVRTLVVPNAGPQRRTELKPMPPPTVVYIGRIHAKKNLIALVHGWRAASRPADARLVLAGWGSDADLTALKDTIGDGEGGVTFVGPVFDAAKAELLAAARFAILPSHSEGLPMAMLEAWADGVPTIMTGECNLPEGFAAGAAIECGYDAAALAAALTQALNLSAERWNTMAEAALNLAQGQFSAAAVAAQWAQIYAKALGRTAMEAQP